MTVSAATRSRRNPRGAKWYTSSGLMPTHGARISDDGCVKYQPGGNARNRAMGGITALSVG